MCGGFFGDWLGKVDPIFNKNNPVERAKRQAQEKIDQDNKDAADAKAAEVATATSNNQTLQAESVATRRRKAAQSLLAKANPQSDVDDVANGTVMGRGQAYATRPSLG